jgi:hypothetical protein
MAANSFCLGDDLVLQGRFLTGGLVKGQNFEKPLLRPSEGTFYPGRGRSMSEYFKQKLLEALNALVCDGEIDKRLTAAAICLRPPA